MNEPLAWEQARDLPWNWVLIRATGLTAWGLLTAVVAWGLLARTTMLRARPAPRAIALHRWLGTLSLLLVLAHMGLLLIDPVVPFTVWQALVPMLAPWQPVEVALGVVAFWLLAGAWALGRLRRRLTDRRLADRWFTVVHRCAYAAWPLATAHYVLAGTDALLAWSIALLIAGTLVVILALLSVLGPAGVSSAPGRGST